MPKVFSNTTPPVNDFVYDLNNDGLHCGPQTAQDQAHAPRSTVPILSNTTIPPSDFPITLGGNLNNDGENCGPPQPFVPPKPPPPPSVCATPAFSTVKFTGSITGATTSPRSGNPNILFTTHITAGQSISVFFNGGTLQGQVYILDPSNTLVATGLTESGIPLPGQVFPQWNASTLFTAASSGTYTFDCTSAAGGTGPVSLSVDDGVVYVNSTDIDDVDVWTCLVVQATKRIFVFQFDSGAQPVMSVYVFNATTHALVAKVGMNAIYEFSEPSAFYNPHDNSVWWLLAPNVMASRQDWVRLDPTSGAVLETIQVANYNFNRGIYLPDKNQVYSNGDSDINDNHFAVYDCTNRTLTLYPYGSPNLTPSGWGYDQKLGRVLVNDGIHSLLAIDVSSHAVTTFLSPSFCYGDKTAYQMPVNGRVMYGMDVGTPGVFGFIAINLDTATVIYDYLLSAFTAGGDIVSLVVNPCTNGLLGGTLNTDANVGNDTLTLNTFDASGNLIQSKAIICIIGGANDDHTCVVYNPVTGRFVGILAASQNPQTTATLFEVTLT